MKAEKLKRAVFAVVVFIWACGSAPAVDSNGLAAHWKFDEGQGTTAYDSAGGNDGTLVNGPAWTTGILDGALDFDGIDDFVDVADDPSLDGMSAVTLAAWVKTGESQVPIACKFAFFSETASDDSYSLSVTEGGIPYFCYAVGATGVTKLGTTNVADNSWHHVVGMYTGSKGSIYIDGQEDPLSRDDPDPGGAINDSGTDLRVGRHNLTGQPDIFLDGLIDDVRIYDRALSADEIEQLYEEGAGPIAHWKFDEGEGSVAYDSAGDNDGYVQGAQWTTGILDGALSFDDVDDYVEVGDRDALDFGQEDSFSISAWVNTASDGPVVYKRRCTGPGGYYYEGYQVKLISENAFFAIEDTAGNAASIWGAGIVTNNQWHHIATVRDASTSQLRLYLDGHPDAAPVGDPTTETLATARSLEIGRSDSTVSPGLSYYGGMMDDVRIYDRALSAEEIERLYEEGVGPGPSGVFYVDGVNGSDLNDGLSLATAFATIQRGIDEAEDGNTVLVYPAVYIDPADFYGKAITVEGVATAAGPPIVETPMDYAFSFLTDEEPNSVLRNFVIRNSFLAAFLVDSSPILGNLTIVDNRFGIEAYAGAQPDISNCIFYNNTQGDLSGCQARYSWVQQDFNEPVEPMFADAGGGDYHLLSERGRYWPQHDIWVLDDVTSPCVDGGDPNDNPGDERMPNGGRINMGAYGGSPYASMSEWLMTGDVSKDGIVNFKDIAVVAGQWLDKFGWAE